MGRGGWVFWRFWVGGCPNTRTRTPSPGGGRLWGSAPKVPEEKSCPFFLFLLLGEWVAVGGWVGSNSPPNPLVGVGYFWVSGFSKNLR